MEFLGFRVCRGPSVFDDKPAIVASVALPKTDRRILGHHEPVALKSVYVTLRKMDPDLVLHRDTGVLVCDLISTLSAFYLEKLNAETVRPRISTDESGEVFHLAFAISNNALVRELVTAAWKIAICCYPESVTGYNSFRKTPVSQFKQLVTKARNQIKSRSTAEVQALLTSKSLPWMPIDHYPGLKDLIQLGYGKYQKLLIGTVSYESSMAGINISLSKLLTQQFLADLAFPVTRQVVVNSAAESVSVAARIGYPVVLKAERGAFGERVYPDLRTDEDVVWAYTNLKKIIITNKLQGNRIFVENFVHGNDYRLTVAYGKLVDTLHMIPACVIGDGVSTITQLVEKENRNPLRGNKSSTITNSVFLSLNEPELKNLSNQGLTTDSVPEKDQKVLLRTNANWSSGGTVMDVGDRVHPDNVDLVCRIADAFNVDILGVDIITEDISCSHRDTELAVIEVNHTPGIFGFKDATGNYMDRAARLLNCAAPELARQQFPMVVIAEGRFSSRTTTLLSKAMQADGLNPGLVNRTGMFVNGQPWGTPGSIDWRDPAFSLLRNKEVDATVVERSIQRLLEYGTGAGGCDVAVFTSLPDAPHVSKIWRNGILPAKTLTLAMQSARKGGVVLVDDDEIASLIRSCQPEKLCVVSMETNSARLSEFIHKGSKGVVAITSEEHCSIRLFDSEDHSLDEPIIVTLAHANDDLALQTAISLGVLLMLGYPASEAISLVSSVPA